LLSSEVSFMSTPASLRIATRKSPLALAQADWVAKQLQSYHPSLNIEFVKITSAGDTYPSPLYDVGGKGLFTKELEEALLQKKADIAVHSMKDIPAQIPEGLALPVICKRIDPRDVLVSNTANDLASLASSARVGTSSLRRQCQLLSLRPDLIIMALRGNVDTRLKKLETGMFDALILAAAGLLRLNIRRPFYFLSPEICLPAAGQGALGLECRIDDHAIQHLIAPLNDFKSFCEVEAERAFTAHLNGGCRSPIAAYAVLEDETVLLRGLIGSPEGRRIVKGRQQGLAKEAKKIGIQLADSLLEKGGRELLQ